MFLIGYNTLYPELHQKVHSIDANGLFIITAQWTRSDSAVLEVRHYN